MAKKCLVIYASLTGNTEKVALRMKATFEKHGWRCDTFKLDRKTDIHRLPFDFGGYDFACVGSGVIMHQPYNEVLLPIRAMSGADPRVAHRARGEEITYLKEPVREFDRKKGEGPRHGRIRLGGAKKAAVFVTYSGYDLGPKEAEPSLALLALEIEHRGFQCIGRFACPGKFVDEPTPGTYHGDIRDRPNERDLLKAEMFVEEMLEEIAE